jgi:hypothetical protein
MPVVGEINIHPQKKSLSGKGIQSEQFHKFDKME